MHKHESTVPIKNQYRWSPFDTNNISRLIVNEKMSQVFGIRQKAFGVGFENENGVYTYDSMVMWDNITNCQDLEDVKRYVIAAYELFEAHSEAEKDLFKNFQNYEKTNKYSNIFNYSQNGELIFTVSVKDELIKLERYDTDSSISWTKDCKNLEEIMDSLILISDLNPDNFYDISLGLKDYLKKNGIE